uniref:Uncharacterized protein n=1 Tax=Acrobeloides nanus TaxID=290746 RepID=A0A914CVB1_9BILA
MERKIEAEWKRGMDQEFGNEDWTRKKRGNGGNGGKVYCPNCKIEGDTATGGDGGWFRKKREIGLIEPDVQIDEYQQNPRFRRGNGGNGGKVYCPGCKIEGDTATGGDGGWF